MTRLRAFVIAAACSIASAAAEAQTAARHTVVDQTGAALPGATVQLLDGSTVLATVITDADGTFALDENLGGTTVVVSLNGFEPASVPRAEAGRVALALARTTETTTVVAPIGAVSSPTGAALGNTLEAVNISRLPSSHMKARESLPLLPAVVRGPDGLLQLGGARAHDTPLVLDGFNVTDPATGTSSINLPFETVRGIEVLRDPMAVTYGGLLAGVVALESRPGGDKFKMGVQGIVPRPRFQSPGFGRIEGIFPRVWVNGASSSGAVRYFAAVEDDYEHIPVPGVTQGRGPDIVEISATVFGRIDAKLGPRRSITVETLAFPSRTRSQGLSPRREQHATTDLEGHDLFAGLTHRLIIGDGGVLTLQAGALGHSTTLVPNGNGTSLLSPAGWSRNWFATATRHAARYTAVATWERLKTIAGRKHDFTLIAELAFRRLRGHVSEGPIRVEDAHARPVRTIGFGRGASIGAGDWPVGMALRDLWQFNKRTQIDAGLRFDRSHHGGNATSGRAGLRYMLDESGLTVLKAGYGKFVGVVPLAVPAFGGYPSRLDRRFDGDTGELIDEIDEQPTLGILRLPRALAATVGLERQLAASLDAQVAFTDRRSSRLATLRVPTESGPLTLESTGVARYRELQVSARRSWADDQQVFVSYVRSLGRGELNDFSSLFAALDAPLLQPGALSWLNTDVRNRIVVWGTVNLPGRVVISPATEWRSGFPYSAVDDRYIYAETPNSRSFPNFFSTDLVVYKTISVRKRSVDLGAQLFNVTNHRNPRDVYAVTGAPGFGRFTNSVGTILRGYMLFKW